MKLTGLARNTYYKYKRQIRAELIAEQDLPKGASIFYEPPNHSEPESRLTPEEQQEFLELLAQLSPEQREALKEVLKSFT